MINTAAQQEQFEEFIRTLSVRDFGTNQRVLALTSLTVAELRSELAVAEARYSVEVTKALGQRLAEAERTEAILSSRLTEMRFALVLARRLNPANEAHRRLMGEFALWLGNQMADPLQSVRHSTGQGYEYFNTALGRIVDFYRLSPDGGEYHFFVSVSLTEVHRVVIQLGGDRASISCECVPL